MAEFQRWPRIVLEHEREHISRALTGQAFKKREETEGLMHDLLDIDACLSVLPVRVQTP